jgi:tetratricopeptide (TPR) repeat protein
LRGPEQARWLQKVSAEHANIRAGLAFASHRGDFDAVFTIVPLLWRYWTGRNRREEGSAWLEPVRVDSIAAAPAARALALDRLGTFAIDRGDYDDAETLLARSLAIYRARDDARGTADALNALGMVAADREQFHAARGLFEESLTLRRTLDDRRAIALSLYNVANLARDEGDLASATALYAEAITSWRALGDRSTEAYVRVAAAVAARQHERPNDAIAGASSAVELFTELDDRGGRHAALTELGRSLAVDGQATAAAETFRTVLRELDAAASEPEMAHNWLEAIEGLALLELAAGRRGRAATLLSCAAAHRQTFGVPYSSPADRDALTVTIAKTRLADEPGWQFGQSWTRADAFTDLLSDESDRATP